jgi:hypothetical protein
MTRGCTVRSTQAGFVTLVALVIMVVIGLVGTLLYTSLLGEFAGEIGARQSVTAMSVAEAGMHWAVNKLTGDVAVTINYDGEAATQTVAGAGGQQVGSFDVKVYCQDGTTSPKIGGCNIGQSAPDQRVIVVTGYVPSKSFTLGRRTLSIRTSQNTYFTKTFCAFDNVLIHQGVTVKGSVGSEGPASPDVTLQAAPDALVQPSPDGSQNGSVWARSLTIQCDNNCATQISGGRFTNQAAGSICGDRTAITNSFCPALPPAGTIGFSGGSLTIDHTNATNYADIDIPNNSNLTFVTTGPGDVLTVTVNSITIGQSGYVIVQGGGTVVLNINSQLNLNQSGGFNVASAGGAMLPASQMIVRSCNNGSPDPAMEFNQANNVSAVFIVPYGRVHMNQSTISQGGILAGTVDVEQSMTFSFEPTSKAVGSGFNHLITWQDKP